MDDGNSHCSPLVHECLALSQEVRHMVKCVCLCVCVRAHACTHTFLGTLQVEKEDSNLIKFSK